MSLDVVILAAGQGKRMNSDRPKVLHELAGKPLLGHGADAVRAAFAGDAAIEWVLQAEQLGTGHAVQQAAAKLSPDGRVLILYGDVPLVRPATLKRLVESSGDGVAVLTAELPDA